MATYVVILNEVKIEFESKWQLCFQKCNYVYDNDEDIESGFRFIWRKPNGNLQPARGQARIPTYDDMKSLIDMAKKEGWLK